jgi:multidrug transporter EmrE-like cation transporter
MFRVDYQAFLQNLQDHSNVLVIGFILTNLLFNIIANASFKVSAESSSWRSFLTWQVIGNLAGFITVLTLTALLRYIPLSVAFPITTGLMVIGVQVVGGWLLFGEAISIQRWIGTVLVIAGIVFLTSR